MTTATKNAKKAPKAAAKKTAKVERKERAKKEGLRDAQFRILRALVKAKTPMPRPKINDAVAAYGDFPTAEKFMQWMADPLGAADPATRPVAEDRAGYPSLLTLGFVKQTAAVIDDREVWVYAITASGRKAYDADMKLRKEREKAK